MLIENIFKKIILMMSVLLINISIIMPSSKFLIIGHRGASGYESENTLSSFKKALELGVDSIELDVYVCATGEIVVMHDDFVDRTTNGHGLVIDMTFDQLRNLIVEVKEKIPTLSEVIELVHGKIPINIELKGPKTAKPVADLLKTYFIQDYNYKDFVVSSFDVFQISEFKNLCPFVKTGVLFSWHKMPEDICSIAKQVNADFIGLDAKIINSSFVEQAHKAGFLIYVWTVNDKKTADKMRAIKVDGIFSNYPDLVL